MLRRLGTALVCFAMFFIAGGHWAVLQSVAWGKMVSDYSQQDGIVSAVQKTFSGDYPCAMCHKIDEQKKQEQQAPVIKVDKKSENLLVLKTGTTLFPPSPDYLLAIPVSLVPANLDFAPPQPVPIVA
jgi:hypothetical protein